MALLLKELNDLKFRFLMLFLLIGVLGYIILIYYDFFTGLMDINTIRDSLAISPLNICLDSEALMQQLELLLGNIDFYVWSQWFGKNLYQFVILGTILLAFSSFAREAEHDTMSFLLCNFTRRQIYISKILAGSVLLLLLVAEGCILPVILSLNSDYTFTLLDAASYALQMGSVSIFMYAAVILFSVLSNDVIKPIIASIIFFVVLALTRFFKSLGSLYVYHYMAGYDIFAGNGINYTSVIVFIGITAVLFAISWQIYKKKDF